MNEKQDSTNSESTQNTRQTQTMKIPLNKVGLIIGKKGQTIKKIEKDSGAKLHFENEEKNNKKQLKISGPHSCVVIARNMVSKLLESRATSVGMY